MDIITNSSDYQPQFVLLVEIHVLAFEFHMFVVLIPCLVCKISCFGYNHLQPFVCLDLCFYGQGLFEDPFYVGKISGLAEMCSQAVRLVKSDPDCP